MALSFARWVRGELDRRDLSGYARQRVEDELRSDEALSALWDAQYAADDRQSNMRTRDGDEPTEAIDSLNTAWAACEDALEDLAEHIVRETVTDVDVHGHTVDLRHAMRVDCPGCEENNVSAFHLGTDGEGNEGWVCGHCGATLSEDHETGDVVAEVSA